MLQISNTSHEKFHEFMNIKQKPGNTEKKLWKKVYTYIPPLRYIPGVLMVAVGNSLSMNACHPNSDIDLFIVTRKNRLWSVRIFTTLYFSLLGQRKTAKNHAGKFCLSFFITEEALSFRDIAIENDIYLYFWIVFLKPILDTENTYKKFLEAQENWEDFSEYKNIFEENKKSLLRKEIPLKKGRRKKSAEIFFRGISFLGDILEAPLKKIFLPKTKKSFQKLGKPFGVVISHDMLKFHDRDRRKSIRDAIEKKSSQ